MIQILLSVKLLLPTPASLLIAHSLKAQVRDTHTQGPASDQLVFLTTQNPLLDLSSYLRSDLVLEYN